MILQKLLPKLTLFCLLRFTNAFLPHFSVDKFGASLYEKSPTILQGAFEYEYLPPNPDAIPDETPNKYSSAYPVGTPAGLRGEAVRSALRSGRCIGWQLSSDPHLANGGILKIQGKGMLDFLNNKFTQEFTMASGTTYQEACLLDPKGRVVDRLKISVLDEETAIVLTSPGNPSQSLMDMLDPLIFPLDRIELTNYDDAFSFSLASTQWKDIESALETSSVFENVERSFPTRADQCSVWKTNNDKFKILVIPSVGMTPQSCVGFTFIFFGNGRASQEQGQMAWESLIAESNPDGPIEIGALEYECLRIEGGIPAFGQEVGSSTKSSPLEVHWQEAINMDKGCYLGQEGVASIAKNPRGPPRLLYSAVFKDDSNIYDTQSRGDKSTIENLTKAPKAGDAIYALGSNEELMVGKLTSVAEAGGTGERCIVALALVRRADSILKRMQDFDLEIDREEGGIVDMDGNSEGIIQPPPLDPLDGLDVIVEGSFTTGKLKMIPSRKLRANQNIFLDDRAEIENYFKETPIPMGPTPASTTLSSSDNDEEQKKREAEKAAAEAEATAADARRKAEKMEMLKKRAEEAMARRKKQGKK